MKTETAKTLAKARRIETKISEIVDDPFSAFDAEELIWHPNQAHLHLEGIPVFRRGDEDEIERFVNANINDNIHVWWGAAPVCWRCLDSEVDAAGELCTYCATGPETRLYVAPVSASVCGHELCEGLRWCTYRGCHNPRRPDWCPVFSFK